jgi:ubiquinol-cytochrome c reductase cytochrome c1 subunit
VALVAAPIAVFASGGGMALDRAPVKENDVASLQRGAAVFVNYCLNCHSASFMRYNRLKDLGLTEDQIRDNLIFTGVKVSSHMDVAMDRKEAGEWFGAAPPDLTLIGRSRSSPQGPGTDWVYTYLRTFYRDPARPTGWNNLLFPNVAMPHPLWQLSGENELVTQDFRTHAEAEAALRQSGKPGRVDEVVSVGADGRESVKYVLLSLKPGQGTMSALEYDTLIADLSNYLGYMAEPTRLDRRELGVWVLMFLAVLFVFAYLLKREFWKDVH